MIYLGWRTGGASSEDADMIQLVSSLLSNGKCGLLDVDIQQQQKMLGVGAEGLQLADYGMMVAIGYPKPGQTLEEARGPAHQIFVAPGHGVEGAGVDGDAVILSTQASGSWRNK